uniref:Peptidase C1A papain C-terminal domain-containing protein n=1 Tax=Tetradesmus obliquus TaxID=3088 RepID=A0A383VIM3_TETOB|eukprot:jgi/Sobl393_1/18631/SZX65368.1
MLQDQGTCSSCVGFAVTAAAEAAVNVFKQQNWNRLSLSEQALSFCTLRPRISCVSGASYDAVVQFLDEGRVAQWPTRNCFPYLGAASSSEACLQLNSGLWSSQLPEVPWQQWRG